jgi:RNA polymerase sigma-70 factor (ECF subfamily)
MFLKHEVVEGCLKQDPKAQAVLYDHYKGRLMGVCRRYSRTTAEAEDIFQDAVFKIFKQIVQLKNPEALDSWVNAIVVRTAIQHYHATKKERDHTSLDAVTDADVNLDGLEQLSLDEITRLIQKLPDASRMVVNLYLIDGFEHHEIAELMHIAIGTSKSQLSRGKSLLRKLLQEKGIIRYEK